MKYLIPLLLLPTLASAQAWNENRLSWDAPVGCTSGPATGCPVTNYQIERSTTAAGTFTFAGTSTVTTFTHTAVAGTNCYRVIAVAAVGSSAPSNVVCKTNTQPSGPPNPPTNLQFVTTAVINGMTVAPIYRVSATGTLGSTVFGFVPLGRGCGEFVARYRGVAFHRVSVRSVAELWGTTDGTNLAAPCVPSA